MDCQLLSSKALFLLELAPDLDSVINACVCQKLLGTGTTDLTGIGVRTIRSRFPTSFKLMVLLGRDIIRYAGWNRLAILAGRFYRRVSHPCV
jgi:hypothetical protein